MKLLVWIMLVLATAVLTVFSLGAVHYQLAVPLRWIAFAGICACLVLTLWLGPKWGWLILLAEAGVIFAWYATIRPSNDLAWAPDVEHGVTGTINGDLVTLSNVRDFRWHTRDSAEMKWRTVTVDLQKIESVDILTSVWGSPLIAHTLISFGFSDGQRIAFSGEIRRQKGQKFSTFGGFFRKFNLVLIAATEADIIALRTNARREDVALYPLKVTPAQARDLFLRYIEMGNDLAQHPKFYNTLLTNCTTIIFELARASDQRLPLDWRILVSGKLPEYLRGIGLLAPDLDMTRIRENARISALGQESAGDPGNFSTTIRSGGYQNLIPWR